MRPETPWAIDGQMDEDLKKTIYNARMLIGRSQEDCAEIAEMNDKGVWSRMERLRGRAAPLSIPQLERVAHATETTVESLLAASRRRRQKRLDRLRS